MKVIGITGGVGAGKSAILKYIQQNYNATILLADEVAHIVKEPGEICYRPLIDILGEDVLQATETDRMRTTDNEGGDVKHDATDVVAEDKTGEMSQAKHQLPRIDRSKMAEKIFHDPIILEKVNQLIHPAVKEYIIAAIAEARKEGKVDYFFVEAALLIEDHYDQVVDEMWYIDASPEIRRIRLKETRGYSDEKVDAIMSRQLSAAEYHKHCKVVIDNSTTKEAAYAQINQALSAEG